MLFRSHSLFSLLATEAVKEGIPGVGIFARGNEFVSFTTLQSEPTARSTVAALTYADLTTLLGTTLFNNGAPFLPPGVALLADYTRIIFCPTVASNQWVLTKLSASAPSITTCGASGLPTLAAVDNMITVGQCFIALAAVNATTLADVDPATQSAVEKQLNGLLTCLPATA